MGVQFDVTCRSRPCQHRDRENKNRPLQVQIANSRSYCVVRSAKKYRHLGDISIVRFGIAINIESMTDDLRRTKASAATPADSILPNPAKTIFYFPKTLAKNVPGGICSTCQRCRVLCSANT